MSPRKFRRFGSLASVLLLTAFITGCNVDITSFSIDGLKIVSTGEFDPPEPIREPVYIVYSISWTDMGWFPPFRPSIEFKAEGPGGVVVTAPTVEAGVPIIFDPVGRPSGTWTVTLTATSDTGQRIPQTITFTTAGSDPVARFSRVPADDYFALFGTQETVPVTFDASESEDPLGQGLTYTWTVNGVVQPTTGSSLTLNLGAGLYGGLGGGGGGLGELPLNIELTVTDAQGLSDSLPEAPVSPFGVLGEPEIGLSTGSPSMSAPSSSTFPLSAAPTYPNIDGIPPDLDITYDWKIDRLEPSQPPFSETGSGPDFAPDLEPGLHQGEVTVTDEVGHEVTEQFTFLVYEKSTECPDQNVPVSDAQTAFDQFSSWKNTGQEADVLSDSMTYQGLEDTAQCTQQQCQEPAVTRDPVHITSGKVFHQDADLSQNRWNRSLVFLRTYFGTAATGDFGPGWSHSYSHTLKFIEGKKAIETDSRGNEFVFRENLDGTFRPARGGIRLEQQLDGSWTTVHPSGARFFYREDGRLERIVDFKGAVTQVLYNAAGEITEVRDDAGTLWSFVVSDGLIREIHGPENTKVLYSYTPSGHLGAAVRSDATGTFYQYTPEGELRFVQRPDASTTEYVYGDDGRVTTVTEQDPSGQQSKTEIEYASFLERKITDAVGEVHGYEVNPFSQLTHREDPDGTVYSFDRNPEGKLTAVHYPGNTSERWSYTPGGLVLSYTARNGESYLVERDPGTERPTALIQPDGSRISVEFDTAGNLTARTDGVGRRTTFTHTPTGLLESISDPDGDTTFRFHDSKGNLIGIQDPLGHFTGLRRDGLGRILETTSPRQHATQYEFGDASCATCSLQVKAVIDALGHRTEYIRDALGRLVETILPNGARLRQKWIRINGQNLVVETEDAIGAVRKAAGCPVQRPCAGGGDGVPTGRGRGAGWRTEPRDPRSLGQREAPYG